MSLGRRVKFLREAFTLAVTKEPGAHLGIAALGTIKRLAEDMLAEDEHNKEAKVVTDLIKQNQSQSPNFDVMDGLAMVSQLAGSELVKEV